MKHTKLTLALLLLLVALMLFGCHAPSPDNAEIIPSAPQGVTVTPTQIDVNAGDSFNVSLRFYDLPPDFDVGSYDFLVSEYDDATGDGDHDKRLFEGIAVGYQAADTTAQ